MSTTTAVVLPAANATSGRGGIFALTGGADLIAVTIFSTVGLFVTILFCALPSASFSGSRSLH